MRIDKNTTIRLGDRNIVKVKLGDVVIWQKTTGPVEGPDYFYIESLGDGNTISVKNVGDGSTGSETPTLEYSTDKNTWDTITFDWTSGTHTTELPVKLNTGGKMYFRNNTRLFSNSSSKYISFSSTVSSNVGGDIRTLSNYLNVNSETTPQTGMFRSLFNGNNKIVDASNLRLPYNTLASGCYYEMFKGCTSLTTAPTLPATTLAIYCYQYMFQGCSSLTTAPELPATTLADSCYQYMFRDCTSLTTAPVLLAITLAGGCYKGMFYRCTSLTTAPALVSTTMSNDCYGYMFSGCTSLNKILVYANSINSSGVEDWLSNVAATGTFYNAGSAVYTTDSPSGIPTGWTEVTTVPTTTSVYAVPDTFSAKSWVDKVRLNYTIMGVNETGMDVPLGEQNELITIGKNTGSSTVTHTETLTYDSMDYTITINQTANDTDEPDYFYIESLGDGNTISVVNQGNGSTTNVTPTLEYSTDKNTWNTVTFDWASGEHTTELPIALNTGGKMYFRNDTRLFSNSYDKYITFSSTVSSNVGGDIRTLSNYINVNNETKPQTGMFCSLFNNNKNIVDASNLRLSYTTLADYCYSQLFYSCTSLTTVPALPATTLASSCYSTMFYGCTSLTTAPALPATTLASSCYQYMFYNCTSLTTAPALPATTLADSCYREMFYSCTSLTTAPTELPSTMLASSCYSSMFYGCSSLTTAPTELPATMLASSCYSSMFSGCTSLTTAPTLPSTTLANNCYQYMFNGCSSLNSITVYADDISASNCTNNWLSGVASSGTFNNMGFALFENGASGVPTGWTEVVPPIQSITANPDTFTIKSYNKRVNCTSTLTITTTTGKTVTDTNTATITVGENTGDTTRTLTETIPYKGSSYQITIVQTANDVKPTQSWNVVSTGTYPFELNTNGYYESTNKGHGSSYSYATLNYSGFYELILECINSGESSYDYGIISQPDVQLSESTSDDGATGSTKVFKNFKGQSSTNPVQITIPSDKGSHFITIKFRKDSSGNNGNDSLQFKVIEP